MGTGIETAEFTQDDFELAFDAAAAGEETEDVIVPMEELAASTEITDDGVGKTPTEEEPAKEEPAKEEPAKEEPAKEESAKEESAKEEPVKEVAPTPEEKAAAQKLIDDEAAELEAAKQREEYTEDEKEQLELTKVDYPEVLAVLEAQKRVLTAQFENMLAGKLKDLSSTMSTQYAPVMEQFKKTAANAHEAEILKGHADAYEFLPTVEEWVESQPSIVKQAYNTVLDSGTAAEVVQLYTICKESLNVAAESSPSEDDAAKVAADAEKARKLAAQEGVTGRASTEKTALDPDDFEGAFEKFAEK